MISKLSAAAKNTSSPPRLDGKTGYEEACKLVQRFEASGDPEKVDRLATQLMLGLSRYGGGREFGLAVIAELRAFARRLGYMSNP